MNMKEQLIGIVAEYRSVPAEEIDPEMPLRDMGLDSLDIAELMQIVEDEFHIVVEPSPELDNIDRLVDYIEKQQ